MKEILTFLLGALISWYLSWHYYKKANDDQKIEFNKIHKEFKKRAIKKLKEEFRNKEKIAEILSELWFEITKKHGKSFTSGRCPRCGSNQIGDISITYGEDQEYTFGVCKECGFELG